MCNLKFSQGYWYVTPYTLRQFYQNISDCRKSGDLETFRNVNICVQMSKDSHPGRHDGHQNISVIHTLLLVFRRPRMHISNRKRLLIRFVVFHDYST